MSKRVSQKQAARVVREQLAKERTRRRRLIVSAVAAALLLVAGLTGWAVLANQRSDSYTAPQAAASGATGLRLGSGPVTVDVYLDFMCPHCRDFEEQAGATLDKLVADGAITLVYHPVAFLDRYSSTRYSTRSSASAACAADAGKLAPYVAALYAAQPPENSAGLSNDELISIAGTAGITEPAFATCVRDGTYLTWVQHVTDAATDRGVNGTPTVLVDGDKTAATVAAITAAVDGA